MFDHHSYEWMINGSSPNSSFYDTLASLWLKQESLIFKLLKNGWARAQSLADTHH